MLELGLMATFDVVDVPFRYRLTNVVTLVVCDEAAWQWEWLPVKS